MNASTPRLMWDGMDDKTETVPHILVENEELSYLPDTTVNSIIRGDNLLAMRALAGNDKVAGKVKCVFIDPPYNTGNQFSHYADGVQHGKWLSMMKERLEELRDLMSDDGSIWIAIDDNEAHYLKLLCDAVFGRDNFITNVVWQKRISPDARLLLGQAHDDILVYAKDKSKVSLNKAPRTEEQLKGFSNPDNDPRGVWSSQPYLAQGYRPNQMYDIVGPSGRVHNPVTGSCWKNTEDKFLKLVEENRIWFGKDGDGVPRRKTFLSESDGVTSWSWWPNKEVGHNVESKKEIIAIFGADDVFDTPKPERLLYKIISIASNEGDIVLDAFGGSGTTGAVAHKMNRQWVMMEQGEHAHTLISTRLKKVIDCDDPSVVTGLTGWKGGGGYRYFDLKPQD